MRVITLLLATLIAAAAVATAQSDSRGALLSQTAQRERRLALVIGNDAYASGARLQNARNDARAVAAAFRVLGFTTKLIEDADRATLSRAVADFAETLQPADVAFFYYAGHGVQIGGDNFLIPTDFTGDTPTATRLGAVSATDLQNAFGKARVSVMILDACRNNPFTAQRGGSGGLAPMEARGSLVAFATGAGQTASDNPGARNGLFTQELLKELSSPNQTIRDMFYHVRQRVFAASQGKQFPAIYDGLLGDVVLASAPPPAPKPAPAATPPPPRPAPAPSTNAATTTAATVAPRAPFTAKPALPIRRHAQAQWFDSAFIQSASEAIYLPFRLKVAPPLATRRTIAMLVRAVRASAPLRSTDAEWESIEFRPVSDVRTNGLIVEAVMSLRPGEYRVYVALESLDGSVAEYEQDRNGASTTRVTQELKTIIDFVAQGGVPAGNAVAIAESLDVPVLRSGRLSASSVILTDTIQALPSLLTAEQQRANPYVFGTMEIVPARDRAFSKTAELSTLFWVYDAATDRAGKPDITTNYAFYRVTDAGRVFFNRTAEQQTNGTTLPPDYVASGTNPLVQGQAVPLASFSPGQYELDITVHDNRAGDEIVQTVPFSVVP